MNNLDATIDSAKYGTFRSLEARISLRIMAFRLPRGFPPIAGEALHQVSRGRSEQYSSIGARGQLSTASQASDSLNLEQPSHNSLHPLARLSTRSAASDALSAGLAIMVEISRARVEYSGERIRRRSLTNESSVVEKKHLAVPTFT